MPLIVPPGQSLISLEFEATSPLGSLPTFTFGANASPTLELLDAVYDWWHADYRPLQFSSVNLLRIIAANSTGRNEATVGEGGTRSGTGAPPQVATLVRKVTGLAGRANRGRMYWPHVLGPGDVEGNGLIDGDVLAKLQASATDLFNAFETAGWDLQLYHSASSDSTPLTSLQVQSVAATQRRRIRG